MPKKVMVVDDSDMIQSMYRLVLRKYRGCQIVFANNGREALDMLAAQDDIELIILDIDMPVMNGIQFLEAVRKKGKYGQVPVIIICPEEDKEDALKGLSLGAKGNIFRPFRATQLYDLIKGLGA